MDQTLDFWGGNCCWKQNTDLTSLPHFGIWSYILQLQKIPHLWTPAGPSHQLLQNSWGSEGETGHDELRTVQFNWQTRCRDSSTRKLNLGGNLTRTDCWVFRLAGNEVRLCPMFPLMRVMVDMCQQAACAVESTRQERDLLLPSFTHSWEFMKISSVDMKWSFRIQQRMSRTGCWCPHGPSF